MIDLQSDDISLSRNMAKRVQSMALKLCPLLSCGLYIVLFSLVFGIGYHGIVIIFALDVQLGYWSYGFLVALVWFIFNIIFNYVMAVLTKPGSPQTIPMVHLYQIKRNCSKCGIIKPPRTHHCSLCNQCVLQMDHHCPWIGTCVGHHNRRYFMNFITYTTLALGQMLFIYKFRKFDIMIFSLVITLFIVLLGFAVYHWYITIKGKTSLEICFDDPQYTPHKSIGTNLKIVFGTDNIFACLMPSVEVLDNWGDQWDII